VGTKYRVNECMNQWPAAAMMSGARGSAAEVSTTAKGVIELDSDNDNIEDDEKTSRESVV
jgi:hypothetical protein